MKMSDAIPVYMRDRPFGCFMREGQLYVLEEDILAQRCRWIPLELADWNPSFGGYND